MKEINEESNLIVVGGDGVGHNVEGKPAIYDYAQRLFRENLLLLIPEDYLLTVKIILPEGRELAKRTSNSAFGVFEGLSLLGTTGFSIPHTATDQLADFKERLGEVSKSYQDLVFCIGSNGLQVAGKLGIPSAKIVQTGNWLGAMLVEAGLQGARSILLLGYHGKLIKLAGGIFNTSSHVADGKLELIAAAIVRCGGGVDLVNSILNCKTAEAAYQELVRKNMAVEVFDYLGKRINDRSQKYIQKYANVSVKVNSILFDRSGEIISTTDYFS